MTHTTTPEPMLKGDEVMALLKCDRQALYNMRESGRLPFERLSPRRFRYPAAAVYALVEGRKARGRAA